VEPGYRKGAVSDGGEALAFIRAISGFPQIPITVRGLGVAAYSSIAVWALLTALISSLSACFRSRAALQLEVLALRHQIGILQRSVN